MSCFCRCRIFGFLVRLSIFERPRDLYRFCFLMTNRDCLSSVCEGAPVIVSVKHMDVAPIAQEANDSFLPDMGIVLPVPVEQTFFKAVSIVMPRSAWHTNIAEDEPCAIPLGVPGVPVSPLLLRRNLADFIYMLLLISLSNVEFEVCQLSFPSIRERCWEP